MGGVNVDPLLALHLHPAAKDAAAREDKRMRAISVDDGQFEIAVNGRVGYRFPVHGGTLGGISGVML